ncbi:cephalosporin hydroxylase [bacterium]|nr:MAG: cephalosporin hydroxylase [bacterium]
MNDLEEFAETRRKEIEGIAIDESTKTMAMGFLVETIKHNYSYHFDWLGVPIIQYPQDIVAMQEIIWRVQPDVIIETGIARGGSLVFSASMLALIDSCEDRKPECGMDVARSRRRVIGVDIDIRKHNRDALDAHPLRDRMELIEGSSIDPDIVQLVKSHIRSGSRVVICLDSNHTHEHVLAELNAYAGLVSSGSYCIVFDTIIEDLPNKLSENRPWGNGNNPKTAVYEFLKTHTEFEIDRTIQDKLLVTVAPDGYLKRL